MIARKFSLLRQLLLAATLATGFGTLWCCARGLARHLDSRRHGSGRESASSRRARGQVRRHATHPQHPARQPVPGDLSRPERPRAGRSGPGTSCSRRCTCPASTGRPASFLAGPAGKQRLKVFVNEREPTVNWFFVHDGKPRGCRLLRRLRAREQPAGRLHRPGRLSLASRAGRRADSRARRADHGLFAAGARCRSGSIRDELGGPARSLGPAAAIWSMCRPETACDSSTSPRGRSRPSFEAPEPIESVGVPDALQLWSDGHLDEGTTHPGEDEAEDLCIGSQLSTSSGTFTIPTEVDRRSSVYWYEIGNGQAIVDFIRPWSTGEPTTSQHGSSTGSRTTERSRIRSS